MTVTPLPVSGFPPSPPASPRSPDVDAPLDANSAAARKPPSQEALAFGRSVLRAFDLAGTALARADSAERAFIAGRGGLQEMVLERAQADVALSIAGTTTSRVAQSLSTLIGMQI